MARGIRIDFLADVRDFLRGTKDVEGGLDDVVDSLDDVAKEGDQAAEKLEKSFRDSLKTVSKAGKDTGQDLGKDVKRGAHEADEGIKDLKQNTASNLKETAASFHSLGDTIGGIQGLASEALEGFGPLGAAAGAALAIGIGVAQSAFEKQSQRIKDLSADMTSALIDDGGKLSRDSIIAKVRSFAEDGSILKLKDQAEKAHVSVDDFLLALGGDPEALARTRSQLDAYRESVDQTADGRNRFKDEGAIAAIGKMLDDEATAAGVASDALDAYSAVAADTAAGSTAAAEQHASAADTIATAAKDESDALAKTQGSLSAYQSALEAIADPVNEFSRLLEHATKRAPVTIETMIHDLERKAAQRATFEKNLRELARKGGGALVDELRAKGPDAAGAVTKVLAHGTSAEVKRYAALHGKEVGVSVGAGTAAGIKGTDLTPATQAAIDAAAGKVKPAQVPLDPVLGSTTQTEKDYQAFVRSLERKYPAKVQFHGGTKPGVPNP